MIRPGTRRILSLWLPGFAIERWRLCGGPTGPAALIETGARGMVLSAVSPEATALGLAPGQRLTDARTIHPGLATAPHDRTGDAQRLALLASGMERFTPWTAIDGVDGLGLDVTGCAHLHGGEPGLVAAIGHALAQAGHHVQAGLAGTTGAAWALARHAPGIAAPGDESTRLAPLPLSALRLEAAVLGRLSALGLRRIGQVTGLDRASLARRFAHDGGGDGAGLLTRLDQALGRRDEPLTPRAPAPAYRVTTRPAEPLISLAGIETAFASLLDSLLRTLIADGQGARRLTLTAFRADGMVLRETAGFARPVREISHIRRLFADRLPQIDPGLGIDTLMLSAEHVGPHAPAQPDLPGAGTRTAPQALAELVDRIANRLGDRAVYRLASTASHLPERATRRAPALSGTEDWTGPRPRRPLLLLGTPEPVTAIAEIPEGPPLHFRWRQRLYRTARAAGPERIAPEWWDDLADEARTRDYYLVEDTAARRYWLYRDGLYRDLAAHGTPAWYLHGLFA